MGRVWGWILVALPHDRYNRAHAVVAQSVEQLIRNQ